ncbi:uncharacterized protein N7515_005487 [Penicillium bovifimosum]|uniref:Uncharacterized protein n=1 Tax=Penicillium bovifimosum TaxID=126998 RepID=A0A9W9GT71_9EURO|nr:uncharacterized protein N7515_005487 [Penicillium bovifimosum]KAJ5129448.1 hypothetical protein N7515_005487 [Penicillium bovifimosum]
MCEPRRLLVAIDCLYPEGLQFRDDPGHWSCASVQTKTVHVYHLLVKFTYDVNVYQSAHGGRLMEREGGSQKWTLNARPPNFKCLTSALNRCNFGVTGWLPDLGLFLCDHLGFAMVLMLISDMYIQQAASGMSPDAAAASTPASSTHDASPHSYADPRSPSALPSGLPNGLPSVPPLGLPPAKRQRLTNGSEKSSGLSSESGPAPSAVGTCWRSTAKTIWFNSSASTRGDSSERASISPT